MRKLGLFASLVVSILSGSCDYNNDDYYLTPLPHPYQHENLVLNCTVLGEDSLQALDSVEIRWIFPDQPEDTLVTYSNVAGMSSLNWPGINDRSFGIICIPNDTIHRQLDTNLLFTGRELDAGLFEFSIVLDTL